MLSTVKRGHAMKIYSTVPFYLGWLITLITNNKMRVVKEKWMRWNQDNLGCPTTAQDILNHFLNLGNLDKQVFSCC